MYIIKIKQIISIAALLVVIGLGHASTTLALSFDEYRAPEIPAGCDINVPAGYEVSFHVYAVGVQVYRWNGTAWAFIAPEANLFASRNFRGLVGTHYVGPTWESNSGSVVVGGSPLRCTPDPTAIPWLRLTAVSSGGPGIFDGVKYIHRVNTVGGIAPAAPGTMIDQEARIPYTTEYYFYKEVE